MFKRHLTATRVMIVLGGLIVAAAIASQLANATGSDFIQNFLVVLGSAAAFIALYTLCQRLGEAVAQRLDRQGEGGRQLGGMVAVLIGIAVVLLAQNLG